jgi:predicted PurR-regulated permease PerM
MPCTFCIFEGVVPVPGDGLALNDTIRTLRGGVAAATGAAFVVVVLLVLWYAATILLVVFGAVIVALALRGAAAWMARHTGIPARVGVLLMIVGVLATIGTLSWALADDVATQVRELARQLPLALDRLEEALVRHHGGRLGAVALHSLSELDLQRIFSGQVPGILSASLGAVASLAVGVFVCLYVAFDPAGYRNGVLALVSRENRSRAIRILHAVAEALRRWFVGRLVAMLLIGGLTALGLGLIGIPLGITLGLLAGLLNFIPYIGPITSFVPAGLIALLQGPAAVLWVLVLPFTTGSHHHGAGRARPDLRRR